MPSKVVISHVLPCTSIKLKENRGRTTSDLKIGLKNLTERFELQLLNRNEG